MFQMTLHYGMGEPNMPYACLCVTALFGLGFNIAKKISFNTNLIIDRDQQMYSSLLYIHTYVLKGTEH